MPDELQRARACYERHAWHEAYTRFVRADEASPLAADDLERLATSAYLIGRDLEFHRVLERLHRIYVDGSDARRAARCAFWLSLSLLFRGDVGQSNAWLARGQRLCASHDWVEQGHLLLLVAEQQLRDGKVHEAHAMAARALAMGDRLGDADLSATARHVQGRACIEQGQISAGLRLLDETMLAVVAGELSPIVTGLMYCSVIEVCRDVCALSRAREWTSAMSRWCEPQTELVAFTGICMVHRAEIMQFQGSWLDAMAEAGRACERSQKADRKPPAAALYRQGEIHRLRGELTQAEEAYRAAGLAGFEPQPGLALLRMTQGRIDAACAAIRRVLSATTDRPKRVRLLPAHLDIMIAAGELEEARDTHEEIQALAALFDTDVIRAMAVHARGALKLAEGDAQTAIGHLRSAFDAWQRLEAPYDAARTRVLIGRACRALGDQEACALELAAAAATFEQLGARPDIAAVAALNARAASGGEHPLTVREREVLRLVAGGHTNKSIAAALGLSERTVDRHVSNVLSKLDVPSRAAAIASAYDRKLL